MKKFLRLLFAVVLLALIANFFYKTPGFKIQGELRKISKVADILFLIETLKLPSLEHMDIQVSPRDLAKLIEKSNAVASGQLPKDTIPAVLKSGNKSLAAKVRFRGQNSGHWKNEKKSWRVILQGGSEWRGMTEFNLIIPYDRGYLAEPFSFYLGSKLGIFSPPHGFVTMSINNSQSGVYFFTQQWGRELLENIGLSGDTDLYTDKNISSPDPQWGIYNSADNFEKKVSLPDQEDNKENLTALLDTLQDPKEELENNIGNILDLDYTLNWMAHSALTFAHGQQYNHNIVLHQVQVFTEIEPKAHLGNKTILISKFLLMEQRKRPGNCFVEYMPKLMAKK